jgi:hypothetical protein
MSLFFSDISSKKSLEYGFLRHLWYLLTRSIFVVEVNRTKNLKTLYVNFKAFLQEKENGSFYAYQV